MTRNAHGLLMMESFDIFSIPLSAVFKEANALRLHREEVSVPSLPCVTIPPQTHQEQKYLKNKKKRKSLK